MDDSSVSMVQLDRNTKRVSYEKYLDEKTPKRGTKMRLCLGNLSLLSEHIITMRYVHKEKCQFCGQNIFMKCIICNVHVCLKTKESEFVVPIVQSNTFCLHHCRHCH